MHLFVASIAALILIALSVQYRSRAEASPGLRDFVAMAIIALLLTLYYSF